MPILRGSFNALLGLMVMGVASHSPELFAQEKNQGKELIPVRLGHTENFLSLDQSSADFQELYLAGLSYALGEAEERLKSCGYRIELMQEFYQNQKTLSIFEIGQKFNQAGAWVVYGPRRSDDYLLLRRGLGSGVALVSPMANAFAVSSLAPPAFTMAPSIEAFARAAINSVREEKWGKRFGSVVDPTCSACRDFEQEYHSRLNSDESRLWRVEVSEERRSLQGLKSLLRSKPVDYVLLPNFARISGYIITELQKDFPELQFVGSDGWGDGESIFLGGYSISKGINGLSFRGALPRELMVDLYGVHSLIRVTDGQRQLPHYNAVAVVDFMRNLTRSLCIAKPQKREDFVKFLGAQDNNYFKSQIGIAVYQLKDSALSFMRRLK